MRDHRHSSGASPAHERLRIVPLTKPGGQRQPVALVPTRGPHGRSSHPPAPATKSDDHGRAPTSADEYHRALGIADEISAEVPGPRMHRI